MTKIFLILFMATPQGIAIKAFPSPSADACIESIESVLEAAQEEGVGGRITGVCVDSKLGLEAVLGRDA